MLKVFTAFSGYDSQCLALNRLANNHPQLKYELVGWSEIEKNAIQAHNALFPQYANRNYGDISTIDWSIVPDFDLFTYSSPCQDFSNAGRMAGGEEESGTRSSLLWECRKAILAKKPKYLVFENVPMLVSKKFLPLFDKWCKELESYGYKNFYAVLNAKDYGVPQNRNRLFMVSILDKDARYAFPEKFQLKRRLKDVLEKDVDTKYYLPEKYLPLLDRLTLDTDETICLNSKVNGKQPSLPDRVYSPNGISTAVTTCWHPSIVEPLRIREATKKGIRKLMKVIV